MDTTELLAVTQSSYAALEAELSRLTAKQMQETGAIDGWSIKDTIAHIAAWERMCVGWFDALERGEKPDREALISQEWTDKTNARIYEENRDRPLADIRADASSSHQAMLALIERVGDGLFDANRFPWAGGRAIAQWVRGNADEHYDEHREQIIAWRAKLEE
jgi:hypothetical protein